MFIISFIVKKVRSFFNMLRNYVFTVGFFAFLLLGSGFAYSVIGGILLAIAIGVVSVLLGFVFQIRFRSRPPSETDVTDLEHEVSILKESLQQRENENLKLRYDIKNERVNLLSIDWLWEINISGISYEKKKVFDYYKASDSESLIPWQKKSDEGAPYLSRRFIGVLSTKYIVKAGVDLRTLRVADQDGALHCVVPTVMATGVSGVKSDWEIKVELRQDAAFFDEKWVMCKQQDVVNSMDSEFWENEYKTAMESASDIDNLDTELLIVLKEEAAKRVKSLLSMVSGKQVKMCDFEELDSHQTLMEYVQSLGIEDGVSSDKEKLPKRITRK